MRAVRRSVPDRVLQARAVLDSVILVEVSTSVFEEAGRLEPSVLRSLDAIHLLSALDLGDELEGLVTYDDRAYWDREAHIRLEIESGDVVVVECAEPIGQVTPEWTDDDFASADPSLAQRR